MASHNELGKTGEELAAEYLKKENYKILKTNWRAGRNELDIIAEKDETIIVVEVKTRSGNYFGDPQVFVTRQKQKQIIKAANAYLIINNIDKEVRFDIIAIVHGGWDTKINHITDAFYPTLR